MNDPPNLVAYTALSVNRARDTMGAFSRSCGAMRLEPIDARLLLALATTGDLTRYEAAVELGVQIRSLTGCLTRLRRKGFVEGASPGRPLCLTYDGRAAAVAFAERCAS